MLRFAVANFLPHYFRLARTRSTPPYAKSASCNFLSAQSCIFVSKAFRLFAPTLCFGYRLIDFAFRLNNSLCNSDRFAPFRRSLRSACGKSFHLILLHFGRVICFASLYAKSASCNFLSAQSCIFVSKAFRLFALRPICAFSAFASLSLRKLRHSFFYSNGNGNGSTYHRIIPHAYYTHHLNVSRNR